MTREVWTYQRQGLVIRGLVVTAEPSLLESSALVKQVENGETWYEQPRMGRGAR